MNSDINKKQAVAPEIKSISSRSILKVPEIINTATGIKISGKLIKSFLFTTDVALVRNSNADAVLVLHPFVSQITIIRAIMTAADLPVFCGIGGGTSDTDRMASFAFESESLGARGIVLNAAVSDEVIKCIKEATSLPVILTVTSKKIDVADRLAAGVDIFNVSAAAETPDIVQFVREQAPDAPIIASGGPNDETIEKTITAGANAISYTPPPVADIFKNMMDKYRKMF